jgi:hypothetical protein
LSNRIIAQAGGLFQEVFMNEEEEKKLLEGYRKLSPRSRYIALAQIIAGAEMEENARRLAREDARKGGGFVGPDAPLFNGTGAVPGLAA